MLIVGRKGANGEEKFRASGAGAGGPQGAEELFVRGSLALRPRDQDQFLS